MDDLSFTVNGTVEHHPFTTTDNQRFTGAFDDVAGPFPQLTADGHPDGTRFYVEGRLRLPNGSLQVGATLEGFFVQGKAGSADADHMVGGFTKDGVRTDEMPPSEQADGASYRRPDYRIQGPIQYLTSQLASRSIAPGTASSQALSWTITSRLDEPQNVTLTTLGADAGVTFHTSQASGATLTVLLAAREAASIEVIVASHAGGQEAPTLVASTDLGGRQLERLAFADATSSASATGSSPGPGTVLALGGLVLVAVARRRRTDA